ncbi:MAG: polyprenyl diphosphate synthase [Bacilli bacterium]|nr:polyprenyl diphosphate synthase [Bacilli bacterium]
MQEEMKVPHHLAIIVDGNGRWATRQGKSRSEGHKVGAKRVEEIAKHAVKRGIKIISFYIFSTENFKRPKEEVKYLMFLFKNRMKEMSKELKKEHIRMVFSGREEPLEPTIIKAMREIEVDTKAEPTATVNICINYGGQAEIIDATKKIAEKAKEGTLQLEEIDETLFAQHLYQDLPPVDFLIRTSGENRLSNFLLWQNAYAEFYFPSVLFPDFDTMEFDKALLEYNKRNRRFGGIQS